MAKTGLEFITETDPKEVAAVLANGHPPFENGGSVECDHVGCDECWLAWLTTGELPIPKTRREK